MMENFTKDGNCNCQIPQRFAKDPTYPIEYDEQLNEFNLVTGKGRGGSARMYFCFFCGGRLPESKRGELFHAPDPEEINDLKTLAQSIRTEADMRQTFGEPDFTMDWPNDPSDTFSEEWIQQFTYTSRWKTLSVDFFLMKDGSLNMAYSGKYKEI